VTRSSTIVQVFVASPSDVEEEGDILESIILELYKSWSKSLGVTFGLVRWETDTYPGTGADPQSIINSQIGDTYDVFIGIIWSRFGTPTSRAPSGTAEEFHRAVSRIKDGAPDVMIYFKDAPINLSRIDLKQLEKVKEFKESISDVSLYSVFEDLAGFTSSLRAHLAALAQKYSKKHASAEIKQEPASFKTDGIIGLEDDFGFLLIT
jgi:hypothetical protein